MASDPQKIAELRAIVEAVRDRVRARYPEPAQNGAADSSAPQIRVPLADLMPLVHARDAAQAKIAAIGSVNPRAGGLANKAIQAVKKTIARSLQWFVRDQISFNREIRGELRGKLASALEDARELNDIRTYLPAWRAEFDQKVSTNEIQFLRSVADLQGAFQHRSTLMESNFRDIVKAQHTDYLGALDRANIDIQKRLWADLEKVRDEYARLIHDELRVIRLRQPSVSYAAAPQPAAEAPRAANAPPLLDYT